MKKEVVGGVPKEVFGMLGDLCFKLKSGARTPEQLERFLKGKNPFEAFQDLLSDWRVFWQDVSGIEADFSSLRIPKRKRGFDRLLVMAQGTMSQKLFDKCQELFPCWKWTDKSLDDVIDFSQAERSAKEAAYAVWVRNRVEADEELKNLSAEGAKKRCISTITLDERIVYELKYFSETGGQHLDVRNMTRCSGSRYHDGNVPSCDWHVGEFLVGCCDPRFAYPHLRARAVVSD